MMDHQAAIRKAIGYVDSNIRDGADTWGMAACAGYSPSRFHRVFTDATGQTPAEFLRNRRLALSCWDLAFSGHRVLDIALAHGFSSQEAFTRAFARRFNRTPGRFRRGSANPRPGGGGTNGVDIVTMTNVIYPDSRVLEGVMKVGFRLGEGRCPEDIPFPSCLASVLRYLGEDYPWLPLHAHGMEWRLNYGNVHFLGSSGMSFGLLWKEGWHGDNVDHMFVADPREVMAKAFAAAGYSYKVMVKEGNGNDEAVFRQVIMESITRGVPVLAFGVVGPPECCIITGYGDHAEALMGWNFFQDDETFNEGVETLPNGYFMKRNWFRDTWNLVAIGEKVSDFDTALTNRSMLEWALRIMGQTEVMGRHAGDAAFEAWERHLLQEGIDTLDDDTLRRYHGIHHSTVGQLAECRAWAGEFLRHMAKDEPGMAECLEQAANLFSDIHDTMWRVWGECGGLWNQAAWVAFRDRPTRERMAELIRQARALDSEAAALMAAALVGKPA